MRSKIVKWGSSLGLRIPKALAADVAIREGTVVEISSARGQLLIRPAPARYDLEDLLGEVTRENLHAEIDPGVPRGSEGW